MKKYLLFTLALLLLQSVFSFAGSNPDLDKADYYFRHGAYADAITHYENIVKKAPRRKDAVLHAHLGDCYRLTKDPAQAAVWYAKALTAPRKITAEMRLHYAEVLMKLQQYDTAAAVLHQYIAQVPADRRAANMLKGCESAHSIITAFPEGLAEMISINTDRSEIGPAIFNNSLVFTTDSVFTGSAKKDNWTGQHYFNICKVTCDKNGICGTDITPLGGKLNSKYHDGTPVFSANNQQMYFTRTYIENDVFGGISGMSDKQGTVHLEIMVADEYDSTAQQFKKVREFSFNEKAASTTHPALSPDGSMLVFASDMAGGMGAVDLYMCRKAGNGEWAKPVNLGKSINTEGREMFPVFLDNQHLSFASDGQPGIGGLDVFYSSWNEKDHSWGTVVNAGVPVNSSWDDMSLTMYADGRNGYFSSNRPASRKNDNIYHYLKQNVSLNLKITDSLSGLPLEGVSVDVIYPKNKQNLTSNAEGYASARLYPQASYQLSLKRQGYNDVSIVLPADGLSSAVETLEASVGMTSNAFLSYSAKILDEANGEPIDNPLIVVTRDGSNHADTLNLATGISLRQSFEPGAVYRINAIKENYYSDEKVISTKDFNPLNGSLILSDTLHMCKLSVGAVCQIENILYDFDKAAIRADAVTSLDKVIKLMNEHRSLKLQINSHTDCRGTDEYNMRLSNERANVVIRFLASKGIPASRLKARGFGATVPVFNCAGDCTDCEEEGRQRNRRTEFSVLEL